jgi:hypothetical protein
MDVGWDTGAGAADRLLGGLYTRFNEHGTCAREGRRAVCDRTKVIITLTNSCNASRLRSAKCPRVGSFLIRSSSEPPE